MREIKFRGIDIKGNWYFGNLSILKKDVNSVKAGCYISNSVGLPFAYEVRPETIGQFTGLKDKNGKDIYEGDILIYGSDLKEIEKTIGSIVFFNGCFRLEYVGCEENKFDPLDGWAKTSEVIGNIYENPELLTN